MGARAEMDRRGLVKMAGIMALTAGFGKALPALADQSWFFTASDDAEESVAAGEDAVSSLPDLSLLSDDETAALLLQAFRTLDFKTALDLCATDEFVTTGIDALAALRRISPLAVVEWPIDWEAFALRPEGVTAMLVAARLRGAYAADFMRVFGGLAADLADVDVSSMDLEDREGNVSRQMVALDEALRAFDAGSIEVLQVRKCTVLGDALAMGWLDPSYAIFALGHEAAAALGPHGSLPLSIYLCDLGLPNGLQLSISLPLCRYESGWRLQRSCAAADVSCGVLTGGDPVSESDGSFSVSAVTLPQVSYVPSSPQAEVPFASAADAAGAVIDLIGCGTGSELPAACDLSKLFCPEAYFSAADPATLFSIGPSVQSLVSAYYNYVHLGTIGSFFHTGSNYLPVTAPGFSTLSGAMLAAELGARPLLMLADLRYAKPLVIDDATHPEYGQYRDFLDYFSPFPWRAAGDVYAMVLARFQNGEPQDGVGGIDPYDAADAFLEAYPYQMPLDYFGLLNGFWDDLGDAVVAFTAADGTTLDAASDMELHYAGPSQVRHTLFFNGSEWRVIRVAAAQCPGGWRVACIEAFAQLGSIMPIENSPTGLMNLADMTPDDLIAALAEGEAEGMVTDLVDLR